MAILSKENIMWLLVEVIAFIGVLMLASQCTADAMTKQECIKTHDDCHWSRKTGGQVNGWYGAGKRKEVVQSGDVRRTSHHRTGRTGSIPRPVSATPAEEPASAMMRIGIDLRWRRALNDRLNEWFAIHGKASAIPPKIDIAFAERFSGAVPSLQVRAVRLFRESEDAGLWDY